MANIRTPGLSWTSLRKLADILSLDVGWRGEGRGRTTRMSCTERYVSDSILIAECLQMERLRVATAKRAN